MWCGCHGVGRAALGDDGADDLEGEQHGEERERRPDRKVSDRERHPADLRDADRRHVLARRGRPLGVVARHQRPEEDERRAHDHVAGHHDAVVERLAVVDRREHLRQAERRTITPTICTIVASRKTQSSVS
jgi:hypothetical protein